MEVIGRTSNRLKIVMNQEKFMDFTWQVLTIEDYIIING